jgi:hypothetical protein
VSVKRWAVTIFKLLMANDQFEWPYIKGLWHQARIFDPSKRNRADDLIACILVLCRAFQLDDVFWSKIVDQYKVAGEEDGDAPKAEGGYAVATDDRYARMVA